MKIHLAKNKQTNKIKIKIWETNLSKIPKDGKRRYLVCSRTRNLCARQKMSEQLTYKEKFNLVIILFLLLKSREIFICRLLKFR